jgi:PAS domain S-box-containing protein
MRNGMPKILIVDDEWITRLEVEEMLSDLGYDVVGQAETGASAIAMVRELKPDLILMDVEMPGEMNGIDAARVIKAESGTPIIFITGYGDPEYIEAAKEIAPFGYVMKPFDEEEIRALVEIALSKRELELELERANERLKKINLGLKKEVASRKKTERALQKSEEKYRSLIANIPDVIWTADSEGKTVFVSPSIENVFGYTPEEAYEGGNNIFPGRIHSEDMEMVEEAFKKLFEKGNMFDVEFRIKRKDGQWIWAHDRSITVYQIDGLMYADGIFTDITERKLAEKEKARLENQLRQSQKMEAIGTLAGGIAHDFNNLLMAIQSRTSMILMNKKSSHPDLEHLKGIEAHVESATDFTRQLLGFARGGKYEVKPTDLNELVKKQNRLFGRTKKEITLRGKYEKNLWSVDVDRGQIEQVLLNLYVNAWQVMPGGGNLYLETENVILDDNHAKPFSVEPGRYVKISITDTGTGMDKTIREKIFDPFFTTKEPGRGAGLGLASSYGIIKNHGGIINVYSEKGEGSTFNIYLPASEKKVVLEKKSTGHTKIGFETVLFVDDEEMITEIAEDFLGLLGYKAFIARSGKEAIRIYEENKKRIGMVILDMIMPGINGGEVYDRLKKINPKVKVLLSSGYSTDGRVDEILDRGCNGFIQKPFKIKDLSQKLREILDQE